MKARTDARKRPDVISLTLGPEYIRLLKDAAAQQDCSVSSVVRSLAGTLADKGADNGKS